MKQVPLLIVFLGFPGSGKTYFATRLSKEIQAVTLNSDALRLSMFRSLENIEHIRQTEQSRLYEDVFGAMDYVAKQTLLAGYSVIYDAQQTKRQNRSNIKKLAASAGSLPLLVWIKTDPKVAMKRGQERDARSDSHVYVAEKMKMLVERFDKVTNLPEPNENTIEISGETSFEKQYNSFIRQLSKIQERLV